VCRLAIHELECVVHALYPFSIAHSIIHSSLEHLAVDCFHTRAVSPVALLCITNSDLGREGEVVPVPGRLVLPGQERVGSGMM